MKDKILLLVSIATNDIQTLVATSEDAEYAVYCRMGQLRIDIKNLFKKEELENKN